MLINRALKVFWYQHPGSNGNFGDELNWFLIEKLSGRKVQHATPYDATKWEKIKSILYYLLIDRMSLKDVCKTQAWKYLWNQQLIFAIGSIISAYDVKNVKVWGAGIMSSSAAIHPAQFLAVRGKYTQARLLELGYPFPDFIGDPALLLPLVYPKERSEKFKVGIIPHYIHFEDVKKVVGTQDIIVINMLDPIEKIIDDITSCEMTLSTSLHGIIVSHAYRIKSLWVKSSALALKPLAGDDIKFADYFSSVNLEEYQAFEMDFSASREFTAEADEKHKNRMLPDEKILVERCTGLLQSAPFRVKRKYKIRLVKGS